MKMIKHAVEADEASQTSVSDAVDEDVIERHMSWQQQIQQSVNEALDKYRSKLCRQGSVHRKRR